MKETTKQQSAREEFQQGLTDLTNKNVQQTTLIQEDNPYNAVCFSQSKTTTHLERYLWIEPSDYLKHSNIATLKQIRDMVCPNTDFQYLPQFSLYPNKTNVRDYKIVNLLDVLKMLQGNELKEKARRIREAKEMGDEALKNRIKGTLPCITHTGIFIPRSNAGLKFPAFTYQLDIDKVPNPQEILKKIISDKELVVLFASISPSGNGIKGMLFLKDLMLRRESWTHEKYSLAYHQVTDILSEYFFAKHGVRIDPQMKAISQPFYLFHSADLHIHKNFSRWI